MTDRSLRVLQVNTSDTFGGAARVTRNLFEVFRSRGHRAWLAVGQKASDDPDILVIPNNEAGGHLVRTLGKTFESALGIEDYRFPGTDRLLSMTSDTPDIVHCHNLHGGYFDLRALAHLSTRVPVVLTLHDAWLLSGHCAHSLACERWKAGCGHCPDLTLYPAVRRDATAFNWRRKRGIFESSSLHVATPCRWLMDKVEQSMLAASVTSARVIPNGVDLSLFRPADRRGARASLEIPHEAKVILFAGEGLRANVWKDYRTVQAAIDLTSAGMDGERPLFIGLGEDGPSEHPGEANVRFVPYQADQAVVARYYQAADLYVHAARAETFPNTVLEALACGTPVVATGVGGIPEQVDDGETGFLVGQGDAHALAERLRHLLADDALRQRVGARAALTARQRFSLQAQADAYLAWYGELLEQAAGATGKAS